MKQQYHIYTIMENFDITQLPDRLIASVTAPRPGGNHTPWETSAAPVGNLPSTGRKLCVALSQSQNHVVVLNL